MKHFGLLLILSVIGFQAHAGSVRIETESESKLRCAADEFTVQLATRAKKDPLIKGYKVKSVRAENIAFNEVFSAVLEDEKGSILEAVANLTFSKSVEVDKEFLNCSINRSISNQSVAFGIRDGKKVLVEQRGTTEYEKVRP